MKMYYYLTIKFEIHFIYSESVKSFFQSAHHCVIKIIHILINLVNCLKKDVHNIAIHDLFKAGAIGVRHLGVARSL